MLAAPMAGDLYRQEFSLGNAEDMAEVVEIVSELTVRGETYMNVLKTRDFTPIEPGPFEFKYYAPGIGLVLEENPANGERLELKRIITP